MQATKPRSDEATKGEAETPKNPDAENARHCVQAAIELGDPLPTVDYLVLAVAQAKLGAIAAAHEALEKATDLWPPELQKAASYHATAEGGVLWFEKADTLWQLKERAEEAIRSVP